jgi:predicted RNA polymerase sigma factor
MAPSEASTAADVVIPDRDDTLTLLFMCCHPANSAPSHVALTPASRGRPDDGADCGRLLVPETMAQRIARAKQRIKATGIPFQLPPPSEWNDRLQVVLHVLYLISNEGYTSSSGPDLHRCELRGEAIRLTRALDPLLPDDGEVAGLLALMLLTDARRPARTMKRDRLEHDSPIAQGVHRGDRRWWLVGPGDGRSHE